MTREQISVLNALVTFAVEQLEHLGGLRPPPEASTVSDDEREVARLVGAWALSRQGPLIVEPSDREVIGGDMGHALSFTGTGGAVVAACSCGWDDGPRPSQGLSWAEWLRHAAGQVPMEVRKYVAGRGVGPVPS